jgi:uncharacterized protein (DUF305 family)
MMAGIRILVGLLLCAAVAGGCHHPPPASAKATAGQAAKATARQARQLPKVTDADVKFMQGMIGHHTQAIAMVDLLKTRSQRNDMKLLGQRIEVSQTDEIRMMKTWLGNHGQASPTDADYTMMMAMPDMAMPGMLTQKQMDELAAAKAADFDRLFLEYMIQHHQGALTMVRELMATPGAGQDSSIYAFASDVEADQSAEINRMRALRATMGKDPDDSGGSGQR